MPALSSSPTLSDAIRLAAEKVLGRKKPYTPHEDLPSPSLSDHLLHTWRRVDRIIKKVIHASKHLRECNLSHLQHAARHIPLEFRPLLISSSVEDVLTELRKSEKLIKRSIRNKIDKQMADNWQVINSKFLARPPMDKVIQRTGKLTKSNSLQPEYLKFADGTPSTSPDQYKQPRICILSILCIPITHFNTIQNSILPPSRLAPQIQLKSSLHLPRQNSPHCCIP